MDTYEIDKETIIASSSESESPNHSRRKEIKKRNKKHSSRSRSRSIEKEEVRRYTKRGSTDSRSSDRNRRHKRGDRGEKYDKYKDKNKKDYKREDYHISERNRDRKEDRSRDRYREKERERDSERDRKHKSNRRSSSSKRRSERKRDNRSRSHSQRKTKDQLNLKTSYEKSFSKDKTPSIEIKKRIEEMSKLANSQAPISSSDASKRNKELFISNLPDGLSPKEVMELMNTAMTAMGASTKSGNPIIGAWVSTEQNCTFLEFRAPEEAINAMKLDGISLLGNKIQIGKPRYQDEVTAQNTSNIIFNKLEDMFPTLTSFERDLNNPYLNRTMSQATTVVKASTSLVPTNTPATSKLLISNLPLSFDQNGVHQVLRTFGKIKNIELIKDPITGKSSGNCHVEYETETATANALHYIMGMNLMGNTLYIRRSAGIMPVYSISSTSTSSSNMNTNINMDGISMSINQLGTTTGFISSADDIIKLRETNPSKVICFKNMISLKELEDDDEYDDLYDDVMEECKNYGKVIQVKIPRPDSHEAVQGVGKVYVEYATRDGASFAKEHLQGKNFRGRKVEVVYLPEDMFKKNQLD